MIIEGFRTILVFWFFFSKEELPKSGFFQLCYGASFNYMKMLGSCLTLLGSCYDIPHVETFRLYLYASSDREFSTSLISYNSVDSNSDPCSYKVFFPLPM